MNNAPANKRIVKNTLLLYARQIFVMLISLYTVRVVLGALGEEDYGIYNVVGGFVSMFTMISGALSVSISRFITYELGRPNVTTARLQCIFSTSVWIQVAIGLFISLLIVTFGVWFVEHKLVIPDERMNTALYVLGLSALSFFFSLLTVPYNALIIAHEQMKAFAYMSILEVCLKLLVAYLLVISPIDKLWLYASSLFLVAFIMRVSYAIYCQRHFKECRLSWTFDKQLLKSMFAFSGWTFLGNGVVVLKNQGSNILLNIFGGPVVNAANGIAAQVSTAVYSFVSNFMQAVNPQITKSYSAGNLESMYSLIIKSSKYGFYILLIILLPLSAGIDYVLRLWLVEFPDHTINFIILSLLYSLVECYVTPLVTGVLAQGNIKPYEIALTFIYFANFIASYFCLKIGFAVESVFLLNILFKIFVLIALLLHSKNKFSFPVKRLWKESCLPALAVFVVSVLVVYVMPGKEYDGFLHFVLRTSLIVISICIIIAFIGVTKGERSYLKKVLTEKIGKSRC